jgi:D-hexose-6-phosphate mutarotase
MRDYGTVPTVFWIHPIYSNLEWNPIENGNQAKHVIRLFEKISAALSFYFNVVSILQIHVQHFDQVFQDRLETLSKQFQKGFETLPTPKSEKQSRVFCRISMLGFPASKIVQASWLQQQRSMEIAHRLSG